MRIRSLAALAGLVAATGAFTLAARRTGAVTRIETTVSPASYSGLCPRTVKFTGVIEVDSAPTTVEYQWERSDGATGRKTRLTIKNKGMGVNDTWQIAGHGVHDVFERLHVLSPNDIVSGPIRSAVNCTQ